MCFKRQIQRSGGAEANQGSVFFVVVVVCSLSLSFLLKIIFKLRKIITKTQFAHKFQHHNFSSFTKRRAPKSCNFNVLNKRHNF